MRSKIISFIAILAVIIAYRYKNWISVMESPAGTRHPDLERGMVIMFIAGMIWLMTLQLWRILSPFTKEELIPEFLMMIGGGALFGPLVFWLFNVLVPGVLISDHLSLVKMAVAGMVFLIASWDY